MKLPAPIAAVGLGLASAAAFAEDGTEKPPRSFNEQFIHGVTEAHEGEDAVDIGRALGQRIFSGAAPRGVGGGRPAADGLDKNLLRFYIGMMQGVEKSAPGAGVFFVQSLRETNPNAHAAILASPEYAALTGTAGGDAEAVAPDGEMTDRAPKRDPRPIDRTAGRD